MALAAAHGSADLYSIVSQIVNQNGLRESGINVERRGEAVSVLTPEGEIIIVPLGNGFRMKFRWRGLQNIINRLLELYGELERRISNGSASSEEVEAYDLVLRLLRHLLPSGEIIITPELKDIITRLGMMLTQLPIGETYAPYIVAIGSALSRYRPIIELAYSRNTYGLEQAAPYLWSLLYG